MSYTTIVNADGFKEVVFEETEQRPALSVEKIDARLAAIEVEKTELLAEKTTVEPLEIEATAFNDAKVIADEEAAK